MPFPHPASDETRRRLLLAKALYREAVTEAVAPQRSHRRIAAILSLDLANETLLKAVVWDIGGGKAPKKEFAPLMSQARAMVAVTHGGTGAQPPPLPGEGGASEVHDIRNDAQHRARPPSSETLAECRTHTHDFLAGMAEHVWGVDFDALADSDSVDEWKCRSLLADAERALTEGEFLLAARTARKALIRASRLATEEHRFPQWTTYQVAGVPGMEGIASLARDLEKEFDDVRSRIRDLALGLDPVDYRRLLRLTGHHWQTMDATDHWSDPVDAIDRAWAEWAVLYCNESVVRIEDRFGALISEYE